MTRPRIASLAAVVIAICGVCGSAAVASGDDSQPATPVADATLYTRPGEIVGRTLRFRGTVPASHAGGTLQVQRLTPAGRWLPTAEGTINQDGSFIVRWKPRNAGRYTVRAVLVDAPALAVAASAPPITRFTIYRKAGATWYGPGFFGRRTACGQKMTRKLLGVAHRTLPCGTLVELFHNGRSIVVPVVDRGPFGIAASYDLTQATAQAIGMTATTTIGVATVAEPQPAAEVASKVAQPQAQPTGGTAYVASR